MITTASPPDGSAADDGYDYDSLPVGYYDEVFNRRRGVQNRLGEMGQYQRPLVLVDRFGLLLIASAVPAR